MSLIGNDEKQVRQAALKRGVGHGLKIMETGKHNTPSEMSLKTNLPRKCEKKGGSTNLRAVISTETPEIRCGKH